MGDQWGDQDEPTPANDPYTAVDAVELSEVRSQRTGGRRWGPRLAVVAVIAGLLGGVAVGLTLGVPGVAHSQSGSTAATTKPSTAAAAPDDYLNAALAPLVKNGTITQKQADAVVKALHDAAKARIGRFGTGPFRGIDDVFSAAAKKIGVTEDALRTALRNGQSIADLAKSKKVDPNAVVDAMVAATKADLDQAVKNGKLNATTEQTQLNNLKTKYTAIVNGKAPRAFGFRFGHRFKGQNGASGASGANGANAQFDGAPVGNTI